MLEAKPWLNPQGWREKVTRQFRIPAELSEALDHHCRIHRKGPSEVVTEALKWYLGYAPARDPVDESVARVAEALVERCRELALEKRSELASLVSWLENLQLDGAASPPDPRRVRREVCYIVNQFLKAVRWVKRLEGSVFFEPLVEKVKDAASIIYDCLILSARYENLVPPGVKRCW